MDSKLTNFFVLLSWRFWLHRRAVLWHILNKSFIAATFDQKTDNGEEQEWTGEVATAHEFAGEDGGLNKEDVLHFVKNLRSFDYFAFFERVFPVILEE
jgi:hypothetical protein